MLTRARVRAGLTALVISLSLNACSDAPTAPITASKPQFGKSGANLAATFTFEAPSDANVATSTGVFGTAGNVYVNGVNRLQAYIGVGGKDANLVTYSTGRTLHYTFDATSPAWSASGIPATFDAESDFFGVNWSMKYQEMGLGTVGIVQGDLEFKVGAVTYELEYFNIAVKRLSETEWLLTTDCLRLDPNGCWNYGFTPSSVANLKVIRRKSQDNYGSVAMPITFRVKLS
jgi:hypothetical protein